MNIKYKITKEQLEEAVKKSFSYVGVLRELGMISGGGTQHTIKKKISHFKIGTKHFKGKGWNKGLKTGRKFPIGDYLKLNGKYITSWKLKNRLFEEGIKEKRCDICDGIKWNKKEMPLELHHKNGNKKDNRIDNLGIYCPNCHTQTDTYKTKNWK